MWILLACVIVALGLAVVFRQTTFQPSGNFIIDVDYDTPQNVNSLPQDPNINVLLLRAQQKSAENGVYQKRNGNWALIYSLTSLPPFTTFNVLSTGQNLYYQNGNFFVSTPTMDGVTQEELDQEIAETREYVDEQTAETRIYVDQQIAALPTPSFASPVYQLLNITASYQFMLISGNAASVEAWAMPRAVTFDRLTWGSDDDPAPISYSYRIYKNAVLERSFTVTTTNPEETDTDTFDALSFNVGDTLSVEVLDVDGLVGEELWTQFYGTLDD